MRVSWPREANDAATVTVVVPCYNYGHYLPQVVHSVLTQKRVAPRVIIVDDASPDGSVEVANALADDDSRISVVSHAKNMGHIATYNDGLARVETEFVTLVSADDIVATGALSRATDLMRAYPRVGLVYGLPTEFRGDPKPSWEEDGARRSNWTIWRGKEWLLWSCLRGRNFIFSPEVVMRTSAMRQVGPYNKDLPHSADFEYWLRTAADWDIGRINGPSQAYYRVHGKNMHITTYSTLQIDLEHRLAAFRVLATAEVTRRLPNGDRFLELAMRGICREALLLAERNLDSGGPTGTSLEFLEVAVAAYPAAAETLRGRTLSYRLRRALAGAAPTGFQNFTESYRHQLNRARWVAWRKVGIS
ncbi:MULTISPECIES: glycosyltransferase family 2 protein [Micrococcaceae]|uniref:Glycosyltransferase family 2 protein n=1 Tax=Arthrobacter sedimenti TaxID=2694931 RepID=A0ABV8WNY3_9MICC|nr:glycosyltransferase [Pseudarthrobacter defluvii]WJH24519.1 glycosyltransferase [Pseudarthrobacter defluvii]